MKDILDLYAKLLRTRNRNLTENTYISIVELFIKNGHLDYNPFFLYKMDRLGIKIPRTLLDLFLDYSINNHLFPKEEIIFKNNVFDNDKVNNKKDDFNKFYDYDDPDYAFYFKNRNNYKERKYIDKIFSQLSVDAPAFYPKNRTTQG
jgi:hypothetical protein